MMDKRVLILGGSGYMGKALVERLLQAGAHVTLVNRGKTPDSFGAKVERLKADREERPAFRAVLAEAGEFDFAVDFSAFTPACVSDVVVTLAGRIQHYVFISTNAVYMSDQHNLAESLVEEEAWNLPIAPELRSAYGWDKRGAEEVLVAAHTAGGFPATRLRIPAICGSGDPTQRWLRYHLTLASGTPIVCLRSGAEEGARVPSYAACYSLDVVEAVLATLRTGSSTFGQVYHICGKERQTIAELAALMAACAGLPEQEGGRCISLTAAEVAQLSEQQRAKLAAWNPFDGLDRQTSTKKAEEQLSWAATPVQEWMGETVRWFQSEASKESELLMKDAPFKDEELTEKLKDILAKRA